MPTLKKIIRSFPNKADKRVSKRIFRTNELTKNQSYKLVNLLGYVILLLMAINYFVLLFPPQFFNPDWEFSVIGRIIETVYITMLGLILIFFRPEQQSIKQNELRFLSLLSWLTLVLGIVSFLFAPLLISNSLRINGTYQNNINLQLINQRQQAEQITSRIDNLSEAKLQNLWSRNQQSFISNSNISTAEKKQLLENRVDTKQQEGQKKLQQKLKNQQRSLLKTTFKWLLCTIVAGITFVSIWKYTEWTRKFLRVEK